MLSSKYWSEIPEKDKNALDKNNNDKIETNKITEYLSAFNFDLYETSPLISFDNPKTANTGIHNSRITWIEETALNLSYIGK